jgi:phosphoribosylanthranilate isomerase
MDRPPTPGEILVKICGITNLDDALGVVKAGADAIGFVFAKSPRQVRPAQVRAITAQLPPKFITVGLFVNASLDELVSCAITTGIKAIQLHGEESAEEVRELARQLSFEVFDKQGWPRLTKAFRLRSETDLAQLGNYDAAEAFLIDAYVEGKAGGTGEKADWGLAAKAKEFGKPIILAGGLNPENVSSAIMQVRPLGVDVSSGVEISPGKKDAGKIKEFIRQVRET